MRSRIMNSLYKTSLMANMNKINMLVVIPAANY